MQPYVLHSVIDISLSLDCLIMSLRLLHVISSMNASVGGPAEATLRLCEELQKRGHPQTIVALDSKESVLINNEEIRVELLGPNCRVLGNYSYNAHLQDWISAKASEFDAVLIHGLWQFHGLAARSAAIRSKIPYFVYPHGMLDPWFKETYPLKHLKKWLYWPWAEYRVLRDARAVLFTCEEERRLARQSFWLYQCNELVTSYGTASPPLDSNRLRERFLSSHPNLRGKRLLLFLSRIHEKKGCDLLVAAFAKVASQFPDLHLVMAGPDQTGIISTLRQQAQSFGISDRITWTGMLQGDEKWGAFHACEVFCLPSHQENFGIVVAEALGCGKPVLISNKVNIWREIQQDNAGIVSEDTQEDTLAGLTKWLTLPSQDRTLMERAARQCFERRFSIEQVADSLIRNVSLHIGSLDTISVPLETPTQ